VNMRRGCRRFVTALDRSRDLMVSRTVRNPLNYGLASQASWVRQGSGVQVVSVILQKLTRVHITVSSTGGSPLGSSLSINRLGSFEAGPRDIIESRTSIRVGDCSKPSGRPWPRVGPWLRHWVGMWDEKWGARRPARPIDPSCRHKRGAVCKCGSRPSEPPDVVGAGDVESGGPWTN
jgi:hypothetical protein